MFRKAFSDLRNAYAFAEAIVDTVREPLVVLDEQLRVIVASRSFYSTFEVNSADTTGKLLYERIRLLFRRWREQHEWLFRLFFGPAWRRS